MEEQKIIEGEILIAKFDGWESGRFQNLPNKLHKMVDNKLHGISINSLCYSSDWNELMRVVENIELLGYIVIIERRSCYIQSHDTRSVISTAQFFDSKIETVWTAVVSFIEHYNNTKK